jgi:hypothetical protein
MADTTTKGGPTETVRVWTNVKKEVKDVIAEKTSKAKRQITEAEALSPVIKAWVKREKRKLGI